MLDGATRKEKVPIDWEGIPSLYAIGLPDDSRDNKEKVKLSRLNDE